MSLVKQVQASLRKIWYSKRCIVVFLIILCTVLICSQYSPNQKSIVWTTTTDFDKAVALISRIRSDYRSLHGLRYRSMICTVVRNDPHILEFILRHLISGFSHIVIYDNNRIFAGHDIIIKNLLAPFIAAGVVTHVSWGQESIDSLPNGIKNGNTGECFEKYGKDADWVMVLDTDEYFYYEKQDFSVNKLNDLLVELEKKSVCAISLYWTMMYGEGRVLKPNGTLFDLYPRICKVFGLTKVLARLKYTEIDIPHNAKCKHNTNLTALTWSSNQNPKIELIHYYSKSVEEFLLKRDQSILPYSREPTVSYRDSGPICNRFKFVYSEDYQRAFLYIYEQFEKLSSLKLINLLPPPGLNIKHLTIPEYALFIYMKYRCIKRQEFDNEKYLSTNPVVKKLIENGTYTDGLHHFMINFLTGVKGCWRANNQSICE
jgi:hypothetical protein